MKFLSIMSWKPGNAQKITDLFIKWKQPEGLKMLYGPCTVLGGNKSVSIVEATDEAWAKVDRYWRHVCTMDVYPLMDAVELIKVKP
jgi:hypothetical protein